MTRTSKLAITLSIFAVALRLVGINQPYIDHWSWRQSDVAAIARNFSEHGFHFAYPQIDWAGGAPGYVGTEFPILPFLAAICYKFAGVHDWIGRSQAVIFFALSLPLFFLLVREIFGDAAAIWATFFYSFAPLNVFAGRSFMPDVPSLSLALIGLYFFLRWIDDERPMLFVAAAIAISLSLLIKLPTVVIGAPLLFLVWQKWRWNFLRRPMLWLFTVVTILPSVAWYWHAHQIAERFYPHHFFGEGGFRIESFSWYWNIVRLTATSILTPILAIMAIIGLFVAPRGKYAWLFHWWLAAMILFIIVVGYGNRHPWYQLPLVPIAATLAGVACAFLGSKISSHVAVTTLIDSLPVRQRFALPVYVARLPLALFSTLVAISFAIFAYLYVRPLYRSSAAELRDAGQELKKTTAADALIIAANTGDPTIFYYAERKGWHFLEEDGIYDGNPSDSREAIADLERLRQRGATHLVFTTNTFWWLESYPEFTQHLVETATLMETSSQFRIYKLRPAAK
jgi:4-amino-4-deoxy-L-arabinose transferase-like glycosyltransferase